MGRYWVELDADGFSYTSEPGAHFEWGAVKLLESIREQFKKANATAATPADNFYSLPGHPWLMCKPRQTNPYWYKDSRLDNHVLRDGGEWAWSPDVTVKEWQPTKKAGETGYPKNKWQSVHIPTGAESLTAPAWDAIGLAAGLTLPENMVVVGVASNAPAGADFLHLTPYIQLNSQPGPDDVAVFGFGQYALIFSGERVTLVKTDYESETDVKRLGQWSCSGPAAPSPRGSASLTGQPLRQWVNSVLVIETPPAHLGLVFGSGDAVVVEAYQIEAGEIAPVIVNAQSWWVAGNEGTTLQFQVQVTGYEDADSAVFHTGAFSPDFDLGVSYLPNVEPALDVMSALHYVDAGDVDTTLTTNSYEAESLYSLEQVIVNLQDADGAAWSSDGTNHAGRWRIQLGASTAGYLSPYIRDIALKFGVLLSPRANNPLLLTDQQFKTFSVDTSLYDPDGKRLTVDLWDTGLQLLTNAGFDTRERYPILIWEDTNGNDVPDTIRAAGWVTTPDIEEHRVNDGARDTRRFYRLSAKGLLSRGNSDWLIVPQMVDPSGGGYVEHTYAVHEAVLSMGIDTADPLQWGVATDSMAGTARSRLPGTWNNKPYTLQLDPENIYAPKFDEQKLEYAARIATRWAGWLIYETTAGRVMYHPNLSFELTMGLKYYLSVLLYWSEAEAVLASAPRQKYLIGPTQTVRPVEANSIRITSPEGKEGETPRFDPVVAHDTLGWTSIGYENFVGEPIPRTFSFEEAGTQQDARTLAAVALLTLGQRGVDWSVEVPLAPWNMVVDDTCDVGYCVRLQGKGDYIITHQTVELVHSAATSELRTRLTCSRISASATVTTGGTKPYPGRMVGVLDGF